MARKKKITFPCMNTKLVPADKVQANDYNPNQVAVPEMKLLRISIEADGLTQPIVTYYDKEIDKYIVVDAFTASRCLKIPLSARRSRSLRLKPTWSTAWSPPSGITARAAFTASTLWASWSLSCCGRDGRRMRLRTSSRWSQKRF